MKRNPRSIHSYFRFTFSAATTLALAIAFASPLAAQRSDAVSSASPGGFPSSMQKRAQIMIELNGDAAAVPWAAALKTARAQADAERNYALAHPNLKASKTVLSKQQPVQLSAAAKREVDSVVLRNDQAQRQLLPTLIGGKIEGQVIYRVQRAYNGIAMYVNADKIAMIAALPGVKAVHPLRSKFINATFSDIDFLNTRPAWTNPFPAGGARGEGIKVADIDSGLDYLHKNFGGSGSPGAYTTMIDVQPTMVPHDTTKVPDGIDLVGDLYNGSNSPNIDGNPFDCGGHGTATASLIAGYGETNAGATYTGTYDATNPVMSTMKIPPGFAPKALLYPVRVFGCSGSTNVVVQAIEWAMTNGMQVINMSLGANEGYSDDPDDIAASNAASIGIVVCSAAGNAGDSYYIHSSPAAATGTLSCAATFNDQAGFVFDSNVTSNTAGGGGIGTVYPSVYGNPTTHVGAGGLTPAGDAQGNLVYAVDGDGSGNNNDASSALTNPLNVAGKIVLIDRGTSTFVQKVVFAQNAGAAAVIVDNFNNPAADPIPMGLDATSDDIPAVMISKANRDTIVAASGGFNATTGVPVNPVNVTIFNDNGIVTHGGAVPDTIASYSSRGPRMPDSAIKPDITSPAEVTAVAQNGTPSNPVGTNVENFNGTSSATPHIAGMMALLRQINPTWSAYELNALACSTANHDVFTTFPPGATQFGVGRVGAGRNDVGKAAQATAIAFNGTDTNLVGVSFGVVETPVDGTSTLTKNIIVSNKGPTNITYNTSIQTNPALTGATFTLGTANFTVNSTTTATIPVTFTATGSALKHAREGSVAAVQNGVSRQWLTEAGGYAVFTPTDGSPTLRVTLYAAPKPASSMHATTNGVVPASSTNGSFNINLSGSPVNTGASLGNGFDILSLVKAFELQYASVNAGLPETSVDPNVLRYVGVTSDYVNRAPGAAKSATRIVFGMEGFGAPSIPEYPASDKEIFIDVFTGLGPGGLPDGIADFAIYLGSNANGTANSNSYFPILVNLHTNAASIPGLFTDGPVNGPATADTNAYNNTAVTVPIPALNLGLIGASGTGATLFQYQVVTFDRNNVQVDETPVMTYDVANPGLELENGLAAAGVTKIPPAGAFTEPFYYQDLATNFIPVNYNGANYQNLGSLGVLLLHMHNSNGNHSDVVRFRKPTISGFTPASGNPGDIIAISGANFGSGTVVKFYNGQVATVVNLNSPNTITVKVPGLPAADGPITVSNAAGTSTSDDSFNVLP